MSGNSDFSFLDNMDQLICIEDYEKYAHEHLPPYVRDYYNSGAGEQQSLRLNIEAFRRYVPKKGRVSTIFFPQQVISFNSIK